MDCKQVISARLRTHIDTLSLLEQDETLKAAIAQAVEKIVSCFKTGGRVYFCGNGGSAATASHMCNDLLKGARVLGRDGFRAVSLNDSSPIVTCLANDFSYQDISLHFPSPPSVSSSPSAAPPPLPLAIR